MRNRTSGSLRKFAGLASATPLALLLIVAIANFIHAHGWQSSDDTVFLPLIFIGNQDVVPPRLTSTWNSPIALDPSGARLWVVNPDADSVSVFDAQSFTKIAELPAGEEPWSIVVAPDEKTAFVSNRADGTITVFDTNAMAHVRTVHVGAEPGSLALTPNGNRLVVSLMTENAVAILDTVTYQVQHRLDVAPVPYAIAIHQDGRHAYVTHLVAQPSSADEQAAIQGHGVVSVIDIESGRVIDTIELAPNHFGIPNRMAGISIAGDRAFVAHLRASPELPNRATTSVFAATLSLNLLDNEEAPTEFIPLNDQEIFGSPVNNPALAIPSPDGERLYIVLSGSDLVEVVDIADREAPKLVRFIPVGRNPQGMAINAEGTRGYVMNFLARSITVLDLVNLEVIAEMASTLETLEADVLRGKILFNSATDRRLTQGGWISCASCHFEGWPDGITWRFPDGPRQTPMLWNAGDTLPWHWSAALDEAQDVEDTIEVIQGGIGLAPGSNTVMLGAPLAGQSSDLDALADFLANGFRPISLPHQDDFAAGRQLFVEQGCATCHGGTAWTSSHLSGAPGTLDTDGDLVIDDVLHEVGTLNDEDIRGQKGFDIPSLLGAGVTAPYLHDGSIATMEELIESNHPRGATSSNTMNETEILALVAFLRSIDGMTPPIVP